MPVIRAAAQQRPPAADAALFLLLPVGARAAGLGNATASASGTVDAVWWNPAGLASVKRIETSLNHSQSIIGTSDALVIAGASPFGVTALAARVLDYGGGEATGPDSVPSGSLYPRNVSLGVTHAVRIGREIRLGATYKLVQFRFDCSGECPSLPTVLSSTTAFDVGVQYEIPTRLPLHLGASVRNLGVKIREQDLRASELPSRVQVGASVSYTLPHAIAENARAMLAVDLLDELHVSNPLPRIGGEFVWDDAVYVRGGYVLERRSTESGGASLGIGFALRRLSIDFARNFSGLSADAGQPPAFLSLRVRF
ncbi:MAG: PorV/PorQ family protein [Gemmatimonadaceae bacterium]|nr:PorV/PorQ family protein [Gemmatimonadaceae bacterium]